MTETDERENRLPVWAQNELHLLRSNLGRSEEENSRLRAELDGASGDTDTLLELEESGTYRPLGNGPVIRFADFYSVRYGNVGSGARALIIETDSPMEIRPDQLYKIIVKRRGA